MSTFFKIIILLGAMLALYSCNDTTSTSNRLPETQNSFGVTKITPILLAEDLEACVKFWNDFGFKTDIMVPFEDKLAFVSLKSGSMEIMYQSFAFSNAANPVGIEGVNRSILYLETNALNKIVKIAEQYDVVIPEHTTSHGSREIYIRDPAGNLIGFSEPQ